MIEMSVETVALEANTRHPIVILKDTAKLRALPIWIGESEAAALARALKGVKTERPMTHELLHDVIHRFGCLIKQVEINELARGTYYATIRLIPSKNVGCEIALDARPSDAIALAVIANAPILVSTEVVAEATIPANVEKDQADAEAFKKFLETVNASDFKSEGLGEIGPHA